MQKHVLSVLRQTGRISIDVEVPILVIVGGALMLIARLPAIPAPEWVKKMPSGKSDSEGRIDKESLVRMLRTV